MSSQSDVFPGWSSRSCIAFVWRASLLQFLLQDRLVAASTDENTSRVIEVLERDDGKNRNIGLESIQRS